ncbi:maleylpyruvate isomerase family mycothiol-dependent enzyme [Catellatospora citrea]|uniref:Maleylpyruvate isomerase n=1 Tax=Catellatospora citrea TaxID=53366 RepID=A0A8J3K904_9ACTN|nr:maleylpyruvate isomerase family mycothiol-dependent enzyme [Catellatospora citrea]RKE12424.1 maleylpyruvate isomerase [Catellatospora citrea]GIF96344.1 maleylpyruvate isomerase [Catellatospora citrea]
MQSVDGMVDDVVRSAARFTAAAAALSDTGLRAPSGLARWTRAHVLAHVATSADAYVRLLRSASTDGRAPRRPADAAVPAQAVEEGASLRAAELVGQLNDSLERFAHEARTMSTEAWAGTVTALAGWRHPAWYTLRRCVRELETHHLDLAVGYRTADWPPGYVTWALAETLAALKAQGFPLARVEATDLGRTWDLADDGPTVASSGHVLLGWFSGRTLADGLTSDHPLRALPVPPTWPQPPVPGWGRDY